jgi:large subunit ribosomal protein L10
MRSEKQFLLDEIQERVARSPGVLVAQYQGLGATMTENIRRRVRETGGDFEVVRKRVFLKAARNAGIDLNPELLKGHIAVVFTGEDVIQTTKSVVEFGKESEQAVQVLGGHLDGQFYTGADMERLAQLPGKDQLRSQLLGLFEAPMAQTVGVMQALLTSLLFCLEGRREKLAE